MLTPQSQNLGYFFTWNALIRSGTNPQDCSQSGSVKVIKVIFLTTTIGTLPTLRVDGKGTDRIKKCLTERYCPMLNAQFPIKK